jgi:hypothetical protein
MPSRQPKNIRRDVQGVRLIKRSSEVFNDPELKKRANEFAESAKTSAKTLADRFKDEDVKERFRNVGKSRRSISVRASQNSFKSKKSGE